MELAGFKDVGDVLRAGVYALVYHGQVVYIGKSMKMLGRIYAHQTKVGRPKGPWTSARGVRFDDVFICPCPIEKLDALEHDMINLYKPKYNVNLKNPMPVNVPFELRLGGITLAFNRPRTTTTTVIVERRL